MLGLLPHSKHHVGSMKALGKVLFLWVGANVIRGDPLPTKGLPSNSKGPRSANVQSCSGRCHTWIHILDGSQPW